MSRVIAPPPLTDAPLIPPVPVVRAKLIEALNEVRLLKQLLKLSESAERTVGVDVVGITPEHQTVSTPHGR